MGAPEHQRARELLRRALELDEPRRGGFVEEQCKGDRALGEELRGLLESTIAAVPPELAPTLPARPVEASSVEPGVVRADATALPVARGESSLASSAPGELFGDYRLIREIGRGGMGVVYEAHHVSLDRRVALKVILDRRFDIESGDKGFLLEARAGARIRHAYSVGVHEIGEVHGQHYISMEYVEGEDLATRLRSAPPTIEEAALLVEKVARAVDLLHENGLIHRDLKPSNILIDTEGNPRVTDFGLARTIESLTLEGSAGLAIGTPSYMAPEQARGQLSALGPWTDVFAIGVILYRLLCGRQPFDNEDPFALLVEVAEREPELPRSLRRGVPRALEAICLRCLEKDPSRRYARAGEVAEDLRRYLRREVVLAQPLSRGRQLRRWAWRRPVFASHLGVFSVFFIMEQIWYARGTVDLDYHLTVCAILTAWIASGFALAHGSRLAPTAHRVHLAWTAMDVTFLTATLLVAKGASSALVACYYILLAAAGFSFRGSVVRIATALVCLSYGVLMLDGSLRRPRLDQPYHVDATYLFSFIAIGVMVAYQVERVRSLSRYLRGHT